MRELRTEFRKQLESIEEKVLQLFPVISEDITLATEALLSGDAEVLRTVSERERIIDTTYNEVELLVDQQLALQAPVAGDLRLLLSVLRTVPELERSHDLVVQIAELATHSLSDALSPRTRGLVRQMGDTGATMWEHARIAWIERNTAVASLVEERDEEIDSLHGALMAEIASGVMVLPVAMDMTLATRFYERLGDHARNVARRVSYLVGYVPEP